MNNNTTNNQLAGLNADLDKAIANARTTTLGIIFLSVVSIGVVGYWLNKAKSDIVAFDAPTIANYGVATVQQALPELTPQFTQRAVEFAPELFDRAERELMAMPDKFADDLLTRAGSELDKITPELENELYASLKTALGSATASRKPGETDEQQVKSVIDTLATAYETESTKLIDTLHARYLKSGLDVLAYLEFLADNKGLDRRQELERQSLVTFLTIAARTKNTAGE